MFERLTSRTKDGIAYTKIPANESNMVDVGGCYTGRIVDRIAAYEDTGLTPKQIEALAADKDEQAAKIMRLMEALEEAAEEIENVYGHDTPQTEKYRELLGGAES